MKKTQQKRLYNEDDEGSNDDDDDDDDMATVKLHSTMSGVTDNDENNEYLRNASSSVAGSNDSLHSISTIATTNGDNGVCITFSSFIQILRVNSKIGYKRRTVYEKNLLYCNEYHFKLEWNISSNLLQTMYQCPMGKYFESDIFYEMFNLRVSPNGISNGTNNNKGNVTLFLNLCCLPPKISKIRVKYVLYEESSNTKWKFARDFTYNASLSGYICYSVVDDNLYIL